MVIHPGIAYIKYEKASAAARAMEEMNGTAIAPHVRPLKVGFFCSEIFSKNEFANVIRRLYQVHVVKVVYGIRMNMKRCYVYLWLYQNI